MLRRPVELGQYASEPYRAVLERHEVRFRTREEAKTAVFEYIEIFYNRQRLHSAIGYRTPAEARASMEGITMRSAA